MACENSPSTKRSETKWIGQYAREMQLDLDPSLAAHPYRKTSEPSCDRGVYILQTLTWQLTALSVKTAGCAYPSSLEGCRKNGRGCSRGCTLFRCTDRTTQSGSCR